MANQDWMLDENGNLVPSSLDITKTGFNPMPEPAQASMPNYPQPSPVSVPQPSQQQSGGLSGLLGGGLSGLLGGGSTDGISFGDIVGRLGSAHLALSQDPALQRIGLGRIEERRKLAQSTKIKNRTIEELKKRGREDLANAVEAGLLSPTDAAKMVFSKPDAKVVGKSLVVPDGNGGVKVLYTDEGGDDTPAAFKSLQLRAEAAGLKQGTPEYADFMVRAGAQSGMALTVGKDGQVTFSTGGVTAKPLTEGQSNAVGFYNRMGNAQSVINELEKEGTDMYAFLLNQVPLSNAFQSPAFQRYQRAKTDFITAVLRKESGAAIGQNEFVTEDQKYFPQVGDSPQVIADKRKAREIAIESMKASAGSGAQSSSSGGIKVVGVKPAG